jgi:hypothetical protein
MATKCCECGHYLPDRFDMGMFYGGVIIHPCPECAEKLSGAPFRGEMARYTLKKYLEWKEKYDESKK